MEKTDPIYDFEVRDQIELNVNQWKIAYNMWERAVHQRAPQALIDRLKEIVECYKDADALLKDIQPCFPPEPGFPVRVYQG